MTDHIEATKAMIAVMQAYVDGKPIEYEYWVREHKSWEINPDPVWNWPDFEYRIAITPDTIDWSHVAREWKYMARHVDGSATLFHSEPHILREAWEVSFSGSYKVCAAEIFASYVRGTCDWKDSLVKRPEGV